MKVVKEFYESLADTIQGWKYSTISIIMGVLIAFTFYFFAKFVKKNKSESSKINSVGTLFMLLICLGCIILIISCMEY